MTNSENNVADKVFVSLIFYLPLTVPWQHFAARIGMEPTCMYDGNDSTPKKGNQSLHNYWEYEINGKNTSNADPFVRKLFQHFFPNRNSIVEAVREFTPDTVFLVVAYFSNATNSIELEPDELEFLSSIRARVVFDMYCIGDEE